MVIGFPYYSHDLLVNVKYRTLDKRFWQSKGAEKMLYGLNDVLGNNEIIIVEGELDKLALEEAGITNVVSVPDGAPARVKEGELPSAEEDTKYSYLWNSRAWLDQAVRIVIATDNDGPGDALAEELARRLGRERVLAGQMAAHQEGSRLCVGELWRRGGLERGRGCCRRCGILQVRALRGWPHKIMVIMVIMVITRAIGSLTARSLGHHCPLSRPGSLARSICTYV